MLQIQECARRLARPAVVQAIVVSAAATAIAGSIARPVVAATPAQGGNTACQVNGKLIVPTVDANHTYGWAFVTNFDHAASPAAVTTCLVERFYGQPPWQTQYTVAQHCTVVNNVASPQVRFGNGVAPFDGNAYLSCTLPVPETRPALFWIRANASLANGSQAHTFLAGNGLASGISVTAQTGTTSAQPLTMTSQYSTFQFSHSATLAWGSFTQYGSRMDRQSATTFGGRHKIGANVYGPTTGNTNLILPAGFSFTIGAPGQPYTLDWLVIDPTPSNCCSPG
ncbi:MAG: hypothetical protein KatS3mg053_3436 [Candidatus Roseilinea sp.]|nr:MAG: hypothetical protein KatS3mg053_3436 [Candidatus Roseilinea sp.]